jgi:hypothetical protein
VHFVAIAGHDQRPARMRAPCECEDTHGVTIVPSALHANCAETVSLRAVRASGYRPAAADHRQQ